MSGTATASADFIEQLRSMAVDDVLPRWSRWWGDDVMITLVPDPERRLEIDSELPTLPLAFYEASITLPADWSTRPAGYVLLSESYRPDSMARALIAVASNDR